MWRLLQEFDLPLEKVHLSDLCIELLESFYRMTRQPSLWRFADLRWNLFAAKISSASGKVSVWSTSEGDYLRSLHWSPFGVPRHDGEDQQVRLCGSVVHSLLKLNQWWEELPPHDRLIVRRQCLWIDCEKYILREVNMWKSSSQVAVLLSKAAHNNTTKAVMVVRRNSEKWFRIIMDMYVQYVFRSFI